MQLDGLPQEIEINQTLGIRSQNELPRIAMLSNVVWNVNSNNTSQTSHAAVKISENVSSVPGFSASQLLEKTYYYALFNCEHTT
jgi:hypothetical protein